MENSIGDFSIYKFHSFQLAFLARDQSEVLYPRGL